MSSLSLDCILSLVSREYASTSPSVWYNKGILRLSIHNHKAEDKKFGKERDGECAWWCVTIVFVTA